MNSSTSDRIDNLLLNSNMFSSKLKQNLITHDFSDDIIIITGAAGSIGSTLAKQLIHSTFKKLILIDIAESPLYELIKDLESKQLKNVEFFVLNITEKTSLEHLFINYKPTIILHAAAYKHVPLMEHNPLEAIKLNIFGTKYLADMSITFNVKKFIFISTDKAVNPISIMGLTKLIAERYLKFLEKQFKTTFLITRFGNVLGSNGSVIPLFNKQILNKEPITITDPNISRYFINKEKACNLILKITKIHKSSNTFTFNMGEPIKIIDLAQRILFLHNLNDNYPINYIGLRPGEKLKEEIISNSEKLVATPNTDIFIVENSNKIINSINFLKLENISRDLSSQEIKTILKNSL
ncbi:SDR family NAD(P)-dependent oxidoreductase [Neotamlana laminarinivorans]|uniref:Polysaccharide biosynthesis protein n=1 Tax=Neotamlana laminarinivorans TaxID=2883124 RepID=A0A9X1HWW6_9FLAO|nr:SDR family NAD(P)-dependent oxidoreductase [Tamlana laminarinivorans]MCB4797648.1 polysaccharide biosynthesis protein [Tamlana laminarinivorans]